MALSEVIFPRFTKPAGYVSGAFGKWHVGLTLEQSPIGRGFDEWYGFLGRGGHDYFDLAQHDPENGPMYRNGKIIKDEGYMTTRLTEEAVDFIRRHKTRPFFVYLAYNAVHTPAQAPAEDIERYRKQFPELSETRVILLAMLEHLDKGVGQVVDSLKQEGVWDNTLLFFLTDNGGARAMHANNDPLRGAKSQNYEGGIRTPFIVSWPDRFKGGRTINTPITALDILPTALDAASTPFPKEKPFDGKSLLPLIAGQTQQHHQHLYWSEGGDIGGWAVRSGDLKAVVQRGQSKIELFDLANDPSETTDLAARQPAKVAELKLLYDAWLDQMAEPLSGAPKRWSPEVVATGRRSRERAAAPAENQRTRPRDRNVERANEEL